MKPKGRRLSAEGEEEPGRLKVWGMTARILVDAATIAYDETPEFEHNTHFGDERMILAIEKLGRLKPKVRRVEQEVAAAEEGKKTGEEGKKLGGAGTESKI